MPVAFIGFIVFLLVTTAGLFLSGLLGLAPKTATKCVQYETKFKQYTVLKTIGSLEIREPVWEEDCAYGIELKPGEKASDYHSNVPPSLP